MRDLKARFVTSSIAIIIATVVIYFSYMFIFSLIFVTILAAIVGISLWEFYQMGYKKGYSPMNFIGLVGSLCYIFATYFSLYYKNWGIAPPIIVGIILFLLFMKGCRNIDNSLASIATSFLGIIYIVIPLTFFLKINFFDPQNSSIPGQWWFMYLIVVTKSADIGAYFIGKMCGKKPLAPIISPKKTLEGFLGGILFSLVASFLLIFLTPNVLSFLNKAWVYALSLGLTLSIIGQLSDLSESLIKRDANIKDSSHWDGVGGLLDMMDSLLFTTPLFYIFLLYGNF